MERLEMSKKERQRLEVLSRVKWGDMSLRTAAELLGLSYRHAKRVFRRYGRRETEVWCTACAEPAPPKNPLDPEQYQPRTPSSARHGSAP